MPRAIWNGSISFGLVNIPVKLYSAVAKKTVRFNQLDARSKTRIKQKRVAADTGEEVPYEQIVKGYEMPGGNYVVVSDDELAALAPHAARTIEIEEFVGLDEIDPIFYESAYYLAPDKSAKPYKLLAEAMEATKKVGIASFVLRTKQYLAAVRAKHGKLLLSTMVYADEIVDPATIPEFFDLDGIEVNERELMMAEQLIDSLTAEFQPERFHDTYREELLALIERKAAGEEIAVPVVSAEPQKIVDLMAALEASVAAAKGARKRHPAAREGVESRTGGVNPGEDGPEAEIRTA